MTRERLSTLLRWAGLVLAGGVLASVLSTRGLDPVRPSGPAGVRLSAPGASSPLIAGAASPLIAGAASPLIAQTLSNVAASGIAGPYVTTAAAFSFDGDVRNLPPAPSTPQDFRSELAPPGEEHTVPPGLDDTASQPPNLPARPGAAMPSPIQNFIGLSFGDSCTGGQCGAGYPPDTNGDVGPTYYIQTVNTSVGIFTKTTGLQAAAFTFNSLFAGTNTACDNANQGDPVALYDAQSDRFIVSDFAFTNTTTGPFFECLAASKTADPTGSWWLFALPTDVPADVNKLLADYPKLGVWPDGIYLSANMFDCHINCGAGAVYAGARVWALNRSDLISGSALHAVVFDAGSSVFSLLPSNLRGAPPPAGTPNYFVANDSIPAISSFVLDVFKFHVDFTTTANSTFSGPIQVNIASFVDPPDTVPEPPGANSLDSLGSRLMMQNQYRNISGTESLWVTHTAGKAAPNITGVRWYQLNVTGGTVVTTPVQQSTYRPDTDNRWMGSLAVDRSGDVAIGYSVANSTTVFPSIRYAGRLVTDTVNTLGQTETELIAGTGGQTVVCGTSACERWGDYSAMTVDPVDDCTFWYTTEYYANTGLNAGGNWHTRIGSFKFPGCGVVSPTTTTVTSSANPSVFGQLVTLTATVAISGGGAGTPTGVVTFTIDGSAVGTVGLSGGVATFSTSSLSVGSHPVTASYGGSASFAASGGTLTPDQTVLTATPTFRNYLPLVMKDFGAFTTLMQEGFEGTWPSAGWAVSDNQTGSNIFWGKRNCQASGGSFSAWAIGGGSLGSGLSCGAIYPNNEQSWMVYGPVSLVGATAADFSLQVSVNTASSTDNVCRMASTNNAQFWGICTSGNTSGFISRTLDLSNVSGLGDLRGQAAVWVAVIFQSDNVSDNLPNGAFVDDLLLRKCTAAVCTTQASSSAGPGAGGGNIHEVEANLTRPPH